MVDLNIGTNGPDSIELDADTPEFYGLDGDDIIDSEDQFVAYTMYGGNGKDSMRGYDEDDYLFGGKGKDLLVGYGGNDWLEGGPGKDQFWFEGDGGPSSAGKDTIVDFRVGEDLLFFSTDTFSKLGSDGKLAKKKFHIGSKAEDGKDRVIYDDKKGKLIYDKNGDKAGKKTVVAELTKDLDLTHKDIRVGDYGDLFSS